MAGEDAARPAAPRPDAALALARDAAPALAPPDAAATGAPDARPSGPDARGRDDAGATADAGGAPPVGDGGTAPPPAGQPVFALAGYGGMRAVSRDLGRTWVDLVQEVPNGGDDRNLLRGIGCGDGLCIAGGGTAGATGRLLTTADGKTWRQADTGQPGLSDVAFGDGLWVTVSGHYAARSSDGYAWKISDMGALSYGRILRRMTFAGTRFVAWGDENKCASSTDGIKWDRCVGNEAFRDVAFGAGIYVGGGARLQTSRDGITWEPGQATSVSWLVWTGERFVAGASGRTYLSEDGKTWTSQTGNPPGGPVAYGAGVFVSAGSTSTDGVTWRASQRPATQNGLTDISFTYMK